MFQDKMFSLLPAYSPGAVMRSKDRDEAAVKARIREELTAELLKDLDGMVERAFLRWQEMDEERVRLAVQAIVKQRPARQRAPKKCSICIRDGKPELAEGHTKLTHDRRVRVRKTG